MCKARGEGLRDHGHGRARPRARVDCRTTDKGVQIQRQDGVRGCAKPRAGVRGTTGKGVHGHMQGRPQPRVGWRARVCKATSRMACVSGQNQGQDGVPGCAKPWAGRCAQPRARVCRTTCKGVHKHGRDGVHGRARPCVKSVQDHRQDGARRHAQAGRRVRACTTTGTTRTAACRTAREGVQGRGQEQRARACMATGPTHATGQRARACATTCNAVHDCRDRSTPSVRGYACPRGQTRTIPCETPRPTACESMHTCTAPWPTRVTTGVTACVTLAQQRTWPCA